MRVGKELSSFYLLIAQHRHCNHSPFQLTACHSPLGPNMTSATRLLREGPGPRWSNVSVGFIRFDCSISFAIPTNGKLQVLYVFF